MGRPLLFFSIIATSLAIAACKKPVLEANPLFVGKWQTPCSGSTCAFLTLEIDDDSQGSYYTSSQDITQNVYHSGKIRLDQETLCIGREKKMELTNPPTLVEDSILLDCNCETAGSHLKFDRVVGLDDRSFYRVAPKP